eukprot:1158028-Pelagomonas_calceolata.AAC.11
MRGARQAEKKDRSNNEKIRYTQDCDEIQDGAHALLLMDIMLAGEDQSQANQPNSLAEGPPV